MPIQGFPDSFNAGNPHNLIYGRLGENLNAMNWMPFRPMVVPYIEQRDNGHEIHQRRKLQF
jgi:hypothetical protein